MARDPAALQLRLLQTVQEVASERNSTLVMPVPVELLLFFEKMTAAGPSAQLSPSLADFGDVEAATAGTGIGGVPPGPRPEAIPPGGGGLPAPGRDLSSVRPDACHLMVDSPGSGVTPPCSAITSDLLAAPSWLRAAGSG